MIFGMTVRHFLEWLWLLLITGAVTVRVAAMVWVAVFAGDEPEDESGDEPEEHE